MTGSEWLMLAGAVAGLGLLVLLTLRFVDAYVARLERARNDRAARRADDAARRLLDGRWRT